MAYCSSCGSPVDNSFVFCNKCGQMVGFRQEAPKPFKPNSNLTLAIITTVCCCVPFGIYAIVLANRVETLYYAGKYKEAEMVAQDSKKWSIIGIVTGIIFAITYIVIIIVSAIVTDGEIFEYL